MTVILLLLLHLTSISPEASSLSFNCWILFTWI